MDNPNNQQNQNRNPQKHQPQNQPKPVVKSVVVAAKPATASAPAHQSAVMQIIAAFVVGILVGVIGVSIANKHSSPLYSVTSDASSTANTLLPSTGSILSGDDSSGGIQVANGGAVSNGVMVSDQPAGNSVTLSEVDFQSSGWVAIHADTNGKPGEILGAALFPAGKTTNASVSLLMPTISGTSYFAVLHFNDNPSSRVFNWKTDVILDDNTGHPVMMQFTAQ